ncbi:MAG: amidase [Anaerolineae bacterium]|nr:amidase [Anaerolineae bacterium]
MHPTAWTLTETAAHIADRSISPLELTQAYLDRIQRLNPLLNAYITVTADRALADAHAAEAEIARGAYRGPLHGVPIAVKDLYETAGIPTTAGSSFRRDFIPTQDSAPMSRLRDAGTVLLGKLNLHEWALGVINDNPYFGSCLNPWDTGRSPGGSSGGSGAALAADLCAGSLGSDTRGSIRIPAALCGVVGLKPTFGRVSLRGVVPLSGSLDHAGPMTKSVADAALLLQAIAGYDPADPGSVDVPVEDYSANLTAGVKGLRIGVAHDAFFRAVAPEILAAFEAAAELLARLGAALRPVDLGFAQETVQTSRVMVSCDAAAFHQERLIEHPDAFGADVRGRLEGGTRFTGVEYALARRSQTELKHRLAALFQGVDLLITPCTRMVAPRLDDPKAVEQSRASLSYLTAPFNMAGLPCLSVPCGFTADHLPIGLQIVGRPWQESLVLRAGHAYEQAAGWHLREPDLPQE